MDIKVVGVGGIGSHLASPLCRYVSSIDKKERGQSTLVFWDGDSYEAKNVERQEFSRLGNKAEVTVEKLNKEFPNLILEARPHYVTDDNVFVCIRENDIVFCCVDNHATRKLLSDHCRGLKNVALISAGNDYLDGNAQLYCRRNNRDAVAPITYLHPEIEEPQDRNPADMSCEELAAAGASQLIVTNFMAAAQMLSLFWLWLELLTKKIDQLKYSEIYFDISKGEARAYLRKT